MISYYSIIFDVPDKETRDFFLDLKRYAEFHPLIERVELKATSKGESYRIIEKPFKKLPLQIQYSVEVKEGLDQVIYSISGLPIT